MRTNLRSNANEFPIARGRSDCSPNPLSSHTLSPYKVRSTLMATLSTANSFKCKEHEKTKLKCSGVTYEEEKASTHKCPPMQQKRIR